MRPDTSNVGKIQNIVKPRNVKQVRQFLGMMSHYRQYIQGFSEIAKPLFDLTKKNARWEWSSKCDEAFHQLKSKLITRPILSYPDINGGNFIVDCDASSFAIGCVLSQVQNSEEKVIAYANRALSKTEVNYSVTRKGMLAVVFFTK